MSHTFVIAEAGSNHQNSFETAQRLIEAAVVAKCDAVKFQTYTSSELYSKNTPDFANFKDIPELIRSIEMPRKWLPDLKMLCDDYGIEFMSTPFDERAVEQLVNIGVKRLKVASFEARDPRLLRCVASTKLPIIVSAGVGTGLEEIFQIINAIYDVNDEPDITVLHCNSAYPTPFSDINLGQMIDIMGIKRCYLREPKIGLSDHTEGILIPPIAVAHGAEVIEKHFTLDRKMPGPDHAFAIEPNELKQMVKNIRITESVMGRKDKQSDSETSRNMQTALRSVIVSHDIPAGTHLTADNITTKRPFIPGAVPAHKYDEIVKKSPSVLINLKADDILMYDMLEVLE